MSEWDRYWSKKKGIVNVLYDNIALFYRKFIIPRILNFFLEKNYTENSVLLHAGCGNGDVDEAANKKFKLLSLDNSMLALRRNPSSRMLVQGDVFKLPVKTASIDGIYNLGLMEHFTEDEIIEILKEFRRVVKQDGKITIFWPPEFGLSVVFLKAVHFIANKVFRKNIKLHPDEITKIKSYSHVKSLCERANFNSIDYYFGPKDLFTYCCITIQKDAAHEE